MTRLARHILRTIETVDRRVLAAVQPVDAVTGLPLHLPGTVRAEEAVLVRDEGDIAVPLSRTAVRVQPNRSGLQVLFGAPFFEAYTGVFLDPLLPPEVQEGPLRLHLSIADAGPQYLPRRFTLDLPRSTDPAAADAVFDPVPVRLLRAPAAPVHHGWAVLRVRVTEAGTDPPRPLPGVLVRVYRSPRAAEDAPIGQGMTDWRGRLRGEALVPVTGVPRFRPGAGDDVFETSLPVALEAARLVAFTGAPGTLPDPEAIAAAVPPALDAVPTAAAPFVRTDAPAPVRAGREASVQLSMP